MSDITIPSAESRQAAATSRASRVSRVSLSRAVACGLVGTLLVVATAPVRAEAAPTWRLTLPLLPHPGSRAFSITSFVVGMLLVGYGWYRLSSYAARSDLHVNQRLRNVCLAIAVWATPLLLGPPLLSNDVYSYAAQGELSSHGYDVTKWGPIALGGGPFLRAADSIWHHNPSPYGPVWNKLAAGVVAATGHDPAAAIWGFRIVIALAVVASAWALATLARDLGANPALAVALGIGNPLTLVHVLGGIHNEGLMMALLLWGLVLARRRHRWAALLLITGAAAVKLPAAAGLVYLGWNWREDLDTRYKRFLGAAVAGAVGMLLIVWMSIGIRQGMGWVGALSGTSKVMSTFAPVTMAGLVVAEVLEFFGINVDSDPIVSVFRAGGLLFAAWVGWLLLSNCRRIGTERALGLTLLIAFVLGPVVWPWYLPPAIAVLVVAGAERFRPALTVVCVAMSLAVLPTSARPDVGLEEYHAVFRMLVVMIVIAAALAAQWIAREPVLPEPLMERWRALRSARLGGRADRARDATRRVTAPADGVSATNVTADSAASHHS